MHKQLDSHVKNFRFKKKSITYCTKTERRMAMSLAKKCDRCGKLYELKDIDACGAITNGLVLVRRYKQNARTFSYKYFDLCPECLVSLASWLKN